MKQKILTKLILLAFLLVLAKPKVIKAATWDISNTIKVTQGTNTYYSYLSSGKEHSWIYRITMSEPCENLVIPDKIENIPVTRLGFGEELRYDGDDWRTIFSEGIEPWHDYFGQDFSSSQTSSIETIQFPASITRMDPGAFCGLRNLKEVRLPSQLTTLNSYTFANCPSLKKVILPAKLKTLKQDAFLYSDHITSLTIPSNAELYKTSNGLLIGKKSASVYYGATGYKTFNIPSSVKKINTQAFYKTNATKIVIPKTVYQIGQQAFTSPNINQLVISKDNKTFEMRNQSLYNKKTKTLYGVKVIKNSVSITSKVKKIDSRISVMGGEIKEVFIPSSVNVVAEGWIFFPKQASVSFRGLTPPMVECRYLATPPISDWIYSQQNRLRIPVENEVFVPKKAKSAYVRWAKNTENVTFKHLHSV